MDTGSEKDLFFHSSSLDGVSYEELQEGQRVAYNEGHGRKGAMCRGRQAGLMRLRGTFVFK